MHSFVSPYDTPHEGFSCFEIVTGSVIACLLLSLVCFVVEADGIETEVRLAAESALRESPLQWHAVEVDGQALLISGVVDEHFDSSPLLEEVADLGSVQSVRAQLEIVADGGLCQSRLDVFSRQATIQFLPGSAELTDESRPGLERMAAVMRHCAPRVEVGAHTRLNGDATMNLQLAERRASVVVRELVRAGVVAEQLLARGYGERQPVARAAGNEADARNERVSFRVRGKAA